MFRTTPVEYPSDLHAPGAIDQLIAAHRQVFGGFSMEENSGGGDGDGADDGTGGNSSDDGVSGGEGNEDTDLGFPKNTPVAEMTADQKAAYFEHKASKEEARRKGLSKVVGGKTAEQLAADLKELEELRTGRLSDNEKAIKEAADKARAEERGKVGGKLVTAEFRAALAHVDTDRRSSLIEALNLDIPDVARKYLNDDGDVDADKVKKHADSIAPPDTGNQQQRRRDFGAGQRRQGEPTRGANGKAEAARRFGKQTTNTGA